MKTSRHTGKHEIAGKAGADRGVALLMVLWVLTVLTVIVFSFSYMARTETEGALSFRQGIEKQFLAEAGIEYGIMEIFYRQANRNQDILLDEGMDIWNVDGSLREIKMENGRIMIGITDESGKVDINKTPDVILRNLLGNLGIDIEEVGVIVDSMLDWRDDDGDIHHLNGVESSYYMSLPNPYEAKNADFETLEELLLVKGMTREILYGKGLINYITVYNKSGQVNVNAAPREVLMAVDGVTEEIADNIIMTREIKPITNLQEVGITNAQFFTLGESGTFTIESSGFKGEEKTGYSIRATIGLLGNNKVNYLYYKSPAEIKKEIKTEEDGTESAF
jgi:general secretion pathway protein K